MIRRTRLRPMSDKRRAESRLYFAQRSVFLTARPACEVCKAKPSRDVHHAAGRIGGNYLDEGTWLAVCRGCHDEIHRNPSAAREAGLIVRPTFATVTGEDFGRSIMWSRRSPPNPVTAALRAAATP